MYYHIYFYNINYVINYILNPFRGSKSVLPISNLFVFTKYVYQIEKHHQEIHVD